MQRGFYTLASGMLTQSRTLNTISNNMANASTPGYKKERLLSEAFESVLYSRSDYGSEENRTTLGEHSMLRLATETAVNYQRGAAVQSGRELDFAVDGDAFFELDQGGQRCYTRDGSFVVDEQGYLARPQAGRVQGQQGSIYVGTSTFTADSQGQLFVGDTLIDRIRTVEFADVTQLRKTGEGLFTAPAEAGAQQAESTVLWKTLEGSNVNAADEISGMMVAQRALQSCSQILRMYDGMLEKTVNEVGRL